MYPLHPYHPCEGGDALGQKRHGQDRFYNEISAVLKCNYSNRRTWKTIIQSQNSLQTKYSQQSFFCKRTNKIQRKRLVCLFVCFLHSQGPFVSFSNTYTQWCFWLWGTQPPLCLLRKNLIKSTLTDFCLNFIRSSNAED